MHRRDYALAEQHRLSALEISLASGNVGQAAIEVHGLALTAAGLGRDDDALRLEGAVAAEYEELGASLVLLPFYAAWLPLLGAARARLGEPRAGDGLRRRTCDDVGPGHRTRAHAERCRVMSGGPAPTQVPTGTVTFLFTDIEGSTRLERDLGAERYAEALAEHRRLLREAFARHDGVEIDTQGDAFFVAFPTAPGALAAAADAQDLLASGPLRVRMGLHTGTPLASGDGYVGVDVHRAARIAAAGHGGQVLISASTAALVGTDELRDLGEHRFKDLSAPERVYQLGDGDFPQLKSLQRTNLPVPATPFLGRERELHEVQKLVSRADVRLLTLTGPGGTGKTRLALQAVAEASDRYPAGVFWVPLAPLRDPGLVLETARQAVGARAGLADHIGDNAMLLLFDNFEHMTEAGADVAGLLASCARLDLLVTSREPLHVTGEQEYPVPSLAREEGVDFFLARAKAIEPGFQANGAVAEICRRLDDLPLALELAAARVKALSPAQIRDRLERRLPLLTGGARDAPERQRTLRATIEWSYDLLSDEEKSLFARLAVFRGGCTLDAAEEVVDASLDGLQSLVDKSLVRHSAERFWMLETIREYAAERLEAQGDGDGLRQRHADYFLGLAEDAEPHLRPGAHQTSWLERLDPELENLRLAIDSLRHAGRGADELELVGALARFWYLRGHLREGSSRAEEALAACDNQSPERVKALYAAMLCTHRLGNYQRADAFVQERLELARRLDDAEAVALSLLAVGLIAHSVGEYERALAAASEAAELARAGGYTWILAMATTNLGGTALEQGDYAEARALLEESLALYRQLGAERDAAGGLARLGILASREGRNDEAETLLHESLERAQALVDKEMAIWCLEELASLAVARGHAERAARLTGVIETLREETGHAPVPEEQRLNDQTGRALVSELGEERVAAALAFGREMTFDEAVAYALQSQAP